MKTNFSHPCFRPKKKEPFLLSTKFVLSFFLSTVVLFILVGAFFAKEYGLELEIRDSTLLLSVALACAIIAVIILSIILRSKMIKIKELNCSLDYCSHELSLKRCEISNLKEDIRLAELRCEDCKAECKHSN